MALEDDSNSIFWGLADYESTISDVVMRNDLTTWFWAHRKYGSFGNVKEYNYLGQDVTDGDTLLGGFAFANAGMNYEYYTKICQTDRNSGE
jgi:hypothetical protein